MMSAVFRQCAKAFLTAMCLVFLSLAAFSQHAHARAKAAALVQPGLQLVDAPEFVWSDAEETQLFGVAAHWRRFTAALPVQKAAQMLAAHEPFFQQVLAFPQRIVLFGMQADWHWVADLASTARGTEGTVSALDMHPGRLNDALQARPGLAMTWVPPEARLRYSEQTLLDGRPVVQQLYTVAWPAGKLDAHVKNGLRSAGWLDVSAGEGAPGVSVWRSGPARLMLVPQQTSTGSALFIHHFQ